MVGYAILRDFWNTCCARNRPFPSSPGPLFQNEGWCSAFDMEIIFHSHANKTHFHKKGCAPSFILKVRVFGTRKWPIHRSKILPVTSWQLSNRTVRDISRRSRHSICQSFFSTAWIYNILQIYSGETSRPLDVVARSVAERPHALKHASLTFKNLWEVDL